MPARHAVVFNHMAFEDLGSLKAPLLQRSFKIETVVLGGPIGVYDQQDYPFLTNEIACVRERLAAHKPTLGICLGAQLMAAALGARVYSGQSGSEIGWSPIRPAADAPTPDWFAPLLAPRLSLFHWHGDTFDLPPGSLHLAKTEVYRNQAYSIGNFALGLQFHPEVTATGLERWYVGHAVELHHAGITASQLRSATRKHAVALEEAAPRFWNLWLDYIL
jgi:GMP synthase (glutamine-hydrolysing)